MFNGLVNNQSIKRDVSEDYLVKKALETVLKNKKVVEVKRFRVKDPGSVLHGNRAWLVSDMINNPKKYNIEPDFFTKDPEYTRKLVKDTIDSDIVVLKNQLPYQIGNDDKIKQYKTSVRQLFEEVSIPDTVGALS